MSYTRSVHLRFVSSLNNQRNMVYRPENHQTIFWTTQLPADTCKLQLLICFYSCVSDCYVDDEDDTPLTKVDGEPAFDDAAQRGRFITALQKDDIHEALSIVNTLPAVRHHFSTEYHLRLFFDGYLKHRNEATTTHSFKTDPGEVLPDNSNAIELTELTAPTQSASDGPIVEPISSGTYRNG